MIIVNIEGYFYSKGAKAPPPDLTGTLLDPCDFQMSCRRFNASNLRVMPSMDKRVGTWFRGVNVVGVVDIQGSLTPFFIEKQKLPKLTEILHKARCVNDVVL